MIRNTENRKQCLLLCSGYLIIQSIIDQCVNISSWFKILSRQMRKIMKYLPLKGMELLTLFIISNNSFTFKLINYITYLELLKTMYIYYFWQCSTSFNINNQVVHAWTSHYNRERVTRQSTYWRYYNWRLQNVKNVKKSENYIEI